MLAIASSPVALSHSLSRQYILEKGSFSRY
jgi:hypothetical protein